jgi:hypothetical protein
MNIWWKIYFWMAVSQLIMTLGYYGAKDEWPEWSPSSEALIELIFWTPALILLFQKIFK